MKISIIVPALNEADGITTVLARLAPLRNRGHEVIVVDGGSSDNTLELAPQSGNGHWRVVAKGADAGDGAMLDLSTHPAAGALDNGGNIRAHFRSEAAEVAPITAASHSSDTIRLPGAVEQIAYLGEHWRCRVRMGGTSVWVDTTQPMAVGTTAVVQVPVGALHLFPVAP